ncbi:MAG: UDP-glucose dehydrogenase family protein [Oligoflexia bacterium]|jgi:UDPglucose 6-dehydrogenase
MKVAVIGTGYVGLVAGACFADSGNEVYCVDHDPAKIEALKKGVIPIYEPGLEEIVERAQLRRRIHFTTSTAEAVRACEVVFLAVGTPARPDGSPELKYLRAAVEQVAHAMKEGRTGYRVLVNKSTVPVGSQKQVSEWVGGVTTEPFDVVSNPEFLKEGTAIDDFLKPDRVVIGTSSDRAFELMSQLYAPFVRQGNPVMRMDAVSAELTKYACNAFLASRISFMNELARVADAFGGDIEWIRKGMATDQRIGKHFLYAGLGYGGSCFPKDVSGLVSQAAGKGIELGVVQAAENANRLQREYFVSLVEKAFPQGLQGLVLAAWGLAFKPNTDDMREAPSITIIEALRARGASVRVFDPVAMEQARSVIPEGSDCVYCESALDAVRGANGLLLLTEWNEFRNPDWQELKALLKSPVVVDGRNIFDPLLLKKQGFKYLGVGRR